MRFKVDENLPTELTQLLVERGHDAHTVLDQRLGGSPDARIAEVCKREDRALITLDLGFADIRAYPPADYSGLVVFRLRT
jgi:predicted nuclease of predicted toxin-antitoxin system